MGYRVAVIQNESELLRYSYADTRHLLTRAKYEWSYYTSEDIQELGGSLERYDALIISTNACNSPRILEWLTHNRSKIVNFLKRKEKGLLVLFQMALSDDRGRRTPFPFLPRRFEVRGQYRFRGGEQADQGSLQVGNGQERHPILRFPHKIDLAVVQDRCIQNENAPGLYWGFLRKFSADTYSEIVLDGGANPNRPLLLASRDSNDPRIVLSSLVLDWQRHDDLWENVIRFVVEGPEQVALVRRRGHSSFDMDLLQYALREQRVPHSVFTVNQLAEWTDDDEMFPSVVLDPGWSRGDRLNFLRGFSELSATGKSPSLHYFEEVAPEMRASCVIPRQSSYQLAVDNSIAWLMARWEDRLWDNSFWSTYDVVDLFVTVGEDLDPYKERILEEIRPRLQSNGSYDDVFGATCAVLQMYKWLEYSGQDFDRALNWVVSSMPGQNLYNAATAVDLLARVAPDSLSMALVRRTVERIKRTITTWTDGLETLRYIRTLVSVGEFSTVEAQVGRLMPAATGRTEWLNVFGAAETVAILLSVYANAQQSTEEIERMLFQGIEYLLEQYDVDTGTWREDAVATAKAAKSIYLFNQQASPAMTEAIQSIITKRVETARARAVADLKRRNRVLSQELAAKSSAQYRLERAQRTTRAKSKVVENWLIAALLMLYIGTAGLLVLLLSNLGKLNAFIRWVAQWQQASVPLFLGFALAPVLGVSILLNNFGREPRWLNFARRSFPFLRGIIGPPSNDR